MWWRGTQKSGDFAIGNWDALSPWWREAWQEWLRMRCSPPPNSLSRAQLYRWPVWNNRILAQNHGVSNVLYRIYTNSTTSAHMREFRLQDFLTFEDFKNHNGTIMSARQLYDAVMVRQSVNASDHIIPLSACDSLSRVIQAMWSNTTKNWLHLSAHTPHINPTRWTPAGSTIPSFSKASNGMITKIIKGTEATRTQPKLIKLNNREATMCWRREHKALKQLAPSRRDLLMRLIRNALPLGYKRIHWESQCQTRCLLCDNNAVETAAHIFWECDYVRGVWGNLHRPWRNQARNAVRWRETLTGHEVRLGHMDNTQAEQLWAIVRGCVIRVTWLERNRRYFYPETTPKPATFRAGQALEDIKAHTDAWMRRSNDEEKENIRNGLTHLVNRENAYQFLLVTAHSVHRDGNTILDLVDPQPPTTDP